MSIAKLAMLLPLFQKLDPETVSVFVKFCTNAMHAPDPNHYVKTRLAAALRGDPEPAITVVQKR